MQRESWSSCGQFQSLAQVLLLGKVSYSKVRSFCFYFVLYSVSKMLHVRPKELIMCLMILLF